MKIFGQLFKLKGRVCYRQFLAFFGPRDHNMAYKSKSYRPIFKKLTFLKNSDKNTSNRKKITPHPIKGTVGRGVNIEKIQLFMS